MRVFSINMKMFTKLQLFLLCQLQFLTECTDTNECESDLKWAPGRLKKPVFVTFVNHATCPSWATKHSHPVRPSGRDHLVLPKEEPFAFICGACYSTSRLSANLTASVDGTGNFLTSVPLQSPQGTPEHNQVNYISCLLTYVLTSPLKQGGTFTCQLNRGSKVHKDQVYFSLRKITQYDSKEIKEQADENGKASLKCPTVDLPNKSNLAYVWHFPQSSEEPSAEEGPSIVVPSMGPRTTYRPLRKEQVVLCSAYDFMNPSKIWRNIYTVKGATQTPKESQIAKWGTSGEELNPDSSSFQKKHFRQIIIIMSAVVSIVTISVIIIFFATGACRCSRRRPSHSAFSRVEENLFHQPKTVYGG